MGFAGHKQSIAIGISYTVGSHRKKKKKAHQDPKLPAPLRTHTQETHTSLPGWILAMQTLPVAAPYVNLASPLPSLHFPLIRTAQVFISKRAAEVGVQPEQIKDS